MKPRSRDWPAILGVAAVLALPPALLFRRVLFAGESFFGRDITPFFYPMKQFMVEAVRSGRIPLWNPGILNGEPFFATLQPGLLYPGSLLLYLVPPPLGLDLLTVLHYPLAAGGTYLLLRQWGHGRGGASLGAVAFALGGYFVSVGNFTNNLQTVAWLPWVLLAWSRFLASGRGRDALWFSGACAVAFLGGEPQMLALALGVAVLHGLLDVEGHGTPTVRQVAVLGGTGALALGLVAVQLLPFAELVGHSVRSLGGNLGYATRYTLTPWSLGQLLVPPALETGALGFTGRHLLSPAFTWLVSIYPGCLVLAFAAVGVVGAKSGRWVGFWGVAAAGGLLLALGSHTPVYPALYDVLPPLRWVRYPEKFVFLPALAAAVLAARGLDLWLAGRGRRTLGAALGVVAAAPLALALLPRLGPGSLSAVCDGTLSAIRACDDPAASVQLYGAVGLRTLLLLGGIGVLTAGARRLSVPVLASAAVALAAADLVLANGAVNPSVEREFYRGRPWAAEVLGDRATTGGEYRYRATPLSAGMGRTVQLDGVYELSNLYLHWEAGGANVGQVHDRLLQDGLQGVELLPVSRTYDAGLRSRGAEGTRLLRAMSVRWYADPTMPADTSGALELMAVHPELPIQIWRVADPVPRAYLVDRYVVEGDPTGALAAALDPDFALREAVVLDRPPAEEPEAGSDGSVVSARYDLNRVELEVEADGRMFLVLTDRHFPGWTATVDGEPVPIRLANGNFRSVSVPAGRHRVVFRYRPASVRIGGWLSGASGLVFAAGLFATGGIGRRRRREGPGAFRSGRRGRG